MPNAHAVRSASSSARWINCPGSIRISDQCPEPGESEYAKEGTLAHAVGEVRIQLKRTGEGFGKLEELSTNALGVSEYTMEGRLLGHLYLGCEMVDRIVMKDPDHFLSEENRLRILNLKHIIACHHSEREWGAIQIPATPECLVVCKADQMSADLEQARKALAGKKAGEESDKVFGLGNIPLYKLY